MGGDGRGQRGPTSPSDQRRQVGEETSLQERVEDAPVGAVPADEEDSRGHRNQGSVLKRGRGAPGGLDSSFVSDVASILHRTYVRSPTRSRAAEIARMAKRYDEDVVVE